MNKTKSVVTSRDLWGTVVVELMGDSQRGVLKEVARLAKDHYIESVALSVDTAEEIFEVPRFTAVVVYA